MRDLNTLMQECMKEMKAIGIPIRDEEVKEICSADINYWGICEDNRYLKEYRILINNDLLDEKCPITVLKEIIIHELIHTCPRCMGHGKTFVKYAIMMDEAYHYHVLESKDENSIFHPEKPILHRFICPNCGSTYDSRRPEGEYWCIFCHVPYREII